MPRAKKTTTDSAKTKSPSVKVAKEAVKKPAVTQKVGLQVTIYDVTGNVLRQMPLPKELEADKVNKALLAQYVRVYLTNQRQGTVSTQLRGEVTGTTHKVYRQKGTGKARHGSKKSNLFKGGGVTFGPKPRTFHLKMNKKQKEKAMVYALQLRVKDNGIVGIKDENIQPKTKTMAAFLNKTEMKKRKVLFVLPNTENNNLMLAIRNLPNLDIKMVSNINPYDILTNNHIVFTEQALDSFFKKVTQNG